MLGYNKGEVLKHFTNTLPRGYYYLVLGIKDLRQVVENAKNIMTEEKLDKELEGQSTGPHM